MNLTLTPEEAAELEQLLREAISDLRVEIANTDNLSYKAGLRARHQLLLAVRDRLAAVAA